jgi:aspartate kinase
MSSEARFQRVHKFGGASLATGRDVARVRGLVGGTDGERAVVVVSAHLGVTALLGGLAQEAAAGRASVERVRVRHRGLLRELGLDPELVDRLIRELAAVLRTIARRAEVEGGPVELGAGERDHVLSFGERLSARIVAAALRAGGLEATPVDAFDLGFVSDGSFGRARPVAGVEETLRERLAEVPGVPVVTGFLAKDRQGRLTTLGRNGSDLTAAIVAEALGARELVLWKGVPGVASADPRLVPGARTIEELSFEDALELARAGAEVLHPDAIAPLRRGGVALRVADVNRPDLIGTRLVEGRAGSGPVAVAGRQGLVRLTLRTAETELELADLAPLGVDRGAIRLLVARPGVCELWMDAAALGKGLPAGAGVELEQDLALVQLIGGPPAGAGPRALAHLAGAGIVPLRSLASEGGVGLFFAVRAAEFVQTLRILHEALLARALSAA